jgi:hypothetical protein
VSRLLNGESEFVKRVPDATFGLATFKPEDYQRPTASYELDHDRLQALMLHESCSLISDPQIGETNLVFPFAAYEAKGGKVIRAKPVPGLLGWGCLPRHARISSTVSKG